MKLAHLAEPELEFGAGRHIDVRFGIHDYGPADLGTPRAPTSVRLGVIGTSETVDGLTQWLERCRCHISAKASPHPNLFPGFPGYSNDVGFRSELLLDSQFNTEVSTAAIGDACHQTPPDQAVTSAVEIFSEAVSRLAERRLVDVIACAIPMDVVSLMFAERDGSDLGLDFRDMLKARVMKFWRAHSTGSANDLQRPNTTPPTTPSRSDPEPSRRGDARMEPSYGALLQGWWDALAYDTERDGSDRLLCRHRVLSHVRRVARLDELRAGI
jgi:hypothetical protein